MSNDASILACDLRGLSHERLATMAAGLAVALSRITKRHGNAADDARAALGATAFEPVQALTTTAGKLSDNDTMRPADQLRCVEVARRDYARPSDDRIEIDDHPALSVGDEGVWVAAWLWVDNADFQV